MCIAVSVVVPTYRRPELISRCLEALAAQDMDPKAFEVVVADDAAEESTRRLVEWCQLAGGPEFRYVAVMGTHGPAAARNAGWRVARGAVVAFTDDDCLPSSSWLSEGVKAMGSDAAATGTVVMPLPECPTDYEQDCAGLTRSEFVTANCFCRRDVLTQIGGFDERFKTAWREDSDLHFTLLEHGHRIVRADKAVVVHPIRTGRWGVSLSQQRKTVSNALLFKKHPSLYRQRLPRFPRLYYVICASILVAIGGVAAGSPTVALTGLVIWAGLTAWFSACRLRKTSHAPSHIAEMIFTSILIPPVSLFWHLAGQWKHRVLYA